MIVIELRPRIIPRMKRKNSLSAELVLLPIALTVALAGLLLLTIEENLRVTIRAFYRRL